MPCKDYCNNGYFCGGCKHFIRSTTIAVTGGQVVITIPSEIVRNREKFCICLAQNIPTEATANTPVVVQVTDNATLYSLLTKCGNRVWGDQLRSRKVLHTIALTDVPAMKLCDDDGICCTDHAFPTLVSTAPATAAAAEAGEE